MVATAAAISALARSAASFCSAAAAVPAALSRCASAFQCRASVNAASRRASRSACDASFSAELRSTGVWLAPATTCTDALGALLVPAPAKWHLDRQPELYGILIQSFNQWSGEIHRVHFWSGGRLCVPGPSMPADLLGVFGFFFPTFGGICRQSRARRKARAAARVRMYFSVD